MAFPKTSGSGVPTANPFEAFGSAVEGANPDAQIATGLNPTINQPGGWMVPTTNVLNSGKAADLTENLFKLPKNQIKDLQQRMVSTGLFPSVRVTGLPDNATLSAYNTLLTYSELYQTANPNDKASFTPTDILNTLVATKPKDTSSTSTSTDVTLTNATQAHQALLSAFSNKLGRRPTDQEAASFLADLHAYESANPSTSTTTTNTSTDANGQQTVKSQNTQNTDKGTGSLNFVNDFASTYGAADPTSPEYQAAQHLDFYNLAIQSLTGGGINTGNAD